MQSSRQRRCIPPTCQPTRRRILGKLLVSLLGFFSIFGKNRKKGSRLGTLTAQMMSSRLASQRWLVRSSEGHNWHQGIPYIPVIYARNNNYFTLCNITPITLYKPVQYAPTRVIVETPLGLPWSRPRSSTCQRQSQRRIRRLGLCWKASGLIRPALEVSETAALRVAHHQQSPLPIHPCPLCVYSWSSWLWSQTNILRLCVCCTYRKKGFLPVAFSLHASVTDRTSKLSL